VEDEPAHVPHEVMAAAAFEPGMEFAGYRLERLLGRGGMGVVYEATQISLERTVALKIVAPGLSADIGFRTRFRREGLAQARLEHPNIVVVHEAGEFQETLFLAMQLIRGPSLKKLIVAGELDPLRSVRILRPIADALDTAHEAGMIHRDVKPHNILVGARDHSYLVDFGLTKSAEETGLTRTGEFLGSIDYISPEQIHNEAVTGASDVYALGAVLFECLTGTVPFPKDAEAAVIYAHMEEQPPSAHARRPGLPRGADGVLIRAMAKDPSQRPGSASALILEAEQALAGSAGPHRSGRGTPLAPIARAGSSGGSLALKPTVVSKAGALSRLAARSRRGALVVLGSAIVGVGFVVGQSIGAISGDVAGASVVRKGHTTLTVPATWTRPARAAPIPGLSMVDRAAARDGASGGEVVVGTLAEAVGFALLPEAFVARLGRAPPTDDPVRLAGGAAYRFRDLTVAGLPKALMLFVMPTSAGVVAVGCLAPSSAAGFMSSCERVAGTLRLRGSRALALGIDRAYARVLASAVGDLRAAQTTVDALLGAHTRPGQAALCHELSLLYGGIAEKLANTRPGPEVANANARLVQALRSTASGYLAMGDAASRGSPIAYETAKSLTARALTTTRRQLQLLHVHGY
jgi:hypothetical protein